MPYGSLPEKALSVRQPWAWAIILGGKDVENRSWQAMNHGLDYRGRVCIHASKGMTRGEYENASEFMAEIGVTCPRPDVLIRGAVIGTVEVVDAVKEFDSPWFVGPRGLILKEPEVISPIPASGLLGFFNWKTGGEIERATPWMEAWPDQPKGRRRAVAETAQLPL